MEHELLSASSDIERDKKLTRLLRRNDFTAFLAETSQGEHRFLNYAEYIARGAWLDLVMRWIVVDDLWEEASSIEGILFARLADGLMESEDYDAAYRVLSILRNSTKAEKKRKRCLDACISADKGAFPKTAFAQRCVKYYDNSDLPQATEQCERARYTLNPEDRYFETTKPIDPAARLRLRLHPSSGEIDEDLAAEDFEALKACQPSRFVWEAQLEYALFLKDYAAVREALEKLSALEARDSLFAWLAWFFDIQARNPSISESFVLCQWLTDYVLPFFDWSKTTIAALEAAFLDVPTAVEASEDIYPLTAAFRAQLDCAYTSEDILKSLENLDEDLEKDIATLTLKLGAYENLDDPGFLPLLKEAQKLYPGPSFELIALDSKQADKSTRAAALEHLLYSEDPTVLYEIDRDETKLLMDYLPESLKEKIERAFALIDINLEASPSESMASLNALVGIRQQKTEASQLTKTNKDTKASFVVLAIAIVALLALIYYLSQ